MSKHVSEAFDYLIWRRMLDCEREAAAPTLVLTSTVEFQSRSERHAEIANNYLHGIAARLMIVHTFIVSTVPAWNIGHFAKCPHAAPVGLLLLDARGFRKPLKIDCLGK